ncbi:hypothetical protein DIPPA_23025 [Diplonema papillatum]|nr:hypothetical protein DIPPA_23025 [Diplonema papillatum]
MQENAEEWKALVSLILSKSRVCREASQHLDADESDGWTLPRLLRAIEEGRVGSFEQYRDCVRSCMSSVAVWAQQQPDSLLWDTLRGDMEPIEGEISRVLLGTGGVKKEEREDSTGGQDEASPGTANVPSADSIDWDSPQTQRYLVSLVNQADAEAVRVIHELSLTEEVIAKDASFLVLYRDCTSSNLPTKVFYIRLVHCISELRRYAESVSLSAVASVDRGFEPLSEYLTALYEHLNEAEKKAARKERKQAREEGGAVPPRLGRAPKRRQHRRRPAYGDRALPLGLRLDDGAQPAGAAPFVYGVSVRDVRRVCVAVDGPSGGSAKDRHDLEKTASSLRSDHRWSMTACTEEPQKGINRAADVALVLSSLLCAQTTAARCEL